MNPSGAPSPALGPDETPDVAGYARGDDGRASCLMEAPDLLFTAQATVCAKQRPGVIHLPGSHTMTAILRGKIVRATLALTLAAAAWAVLAPGQAQATEGGGSSRLPGLLTIRVGMMPPPGLRLNLQLADYSANKTLDGDGKPRAGLSNFNLHVKGVGGRLIYVWPGAELWGGAIATGLAVAAHVDLRVRFDVQTPGGVVHREGQSSGASSDTHLTPIMLGWRGETYHQMVGLELFLPTGAFDRTQLANPGRGNRASGASYQATWFPVAAVEANLGVVVLQNSRNPDTNYQGGRELMMDYGVGYVLAPQWQLGVSGYLIKQFSDDRSNGQPVAGGNRAQVLAVGPFLRYTPGRNWGLTIKYQAETKVKNRASGNRMYVQTSTSLW